LLKDIRAVCGMAAMLLKELPRGSNFIGLEGIGARTSGQ
jgi:hypothetical protein